MTFVLSGITGLRNRGVEALVRPVVHRLLTDFASQATVLTRTPVYDAQRINREGVVFVMDGLTRSGGDVLRRMKEHASLFWDRMAPDYRRSRSALARSTALIASGGDVFSSEYEGVFRHLCPLEMALKFEVPVVFLAHSIGPFKRDEEAKAWMRVAREAMLVTIREPASYEYVTHELGLSEDRVHLTADVAFLLEPRRPANAPSWRDAYRIDGDSPLIAVAPSQGIAAYARVDPHRHIEAWIALLDRLVDEVGAHVVIIPHVQQTHPDNDDRIMATNILKRLKQTKRVTLAGWDHSAAEFKGVISECELVIGERMHACLAGLGSAVPTVAVGYSVKAKGIMHSVFGEEVDERRVLVSVEQFLDPAYARASVEKAWESRSSTQAILLGAQDSLREAADRNFVLLRETLCRLGIPASMQGDAAAMPRAFG